MGTPLSPNGAVERAAWRDATRARLARARRALDADDVSRAGRRVAEALEPLLADLASASVPCGPSGSPTLASPSPRPPVVAGYAAVRGEVPVDDALARARALGLVTALPVTSGTTMRFVAFDASTPMRAGRFGIAVPDAPDAPTYAPVELDLVLVPLLGFDARLDRLGMGGGFYDRAFAHRARGAGGGGADADGRPRRPRLVGIAHAFQEVDDVRAMAWDVPLDAVATELGLVERDGSAGPAGPSGSTR